MQEPPTSKILRRPNLSTIQNEAGVEHTLTRVVMSWIKKGLSIVPRLLKKTTPANNVKAGFRQSGRQRHTKVEDKIDSGELLHHLHEDSWEASAMQHIGRRPRTIHTNYSATSV